MFQRSYIFDTIKGDNRKENQDNILVISRRDEILLIIFDGVGSALNGKEATELSKKFIDKSYDKYKNGDDISLIKLMFETHKFLLQQELPMPFTTYSAIFYSSYKPKQIKYSSMGDSRIYAISKQSIDLVSTDDKYSHNSNRITKFLGMPTLQKEDFTEGIFNIENERILLCTDGFYKIMENNLLSFFKVLNFQYLSSIKRSLFRIINENNKDDSTFILVK